MAERTVSPGADELPGKEPGAGPLFTKELSEKAVNRRDRVVNDTDVDVTGGSIGTGLSYSGI
jgi:hypothetical protein